MGREESINLSLSNVWKAWYTFRKGKKKSIEIDRFTYNLEENIYQLHKNLITGDYQHGFYKTFRLTDTKKRTISVASIRDRVVHRLLYDYLIGIFDKRFVFDAWSCRKDKGLLKAITRTQKLLSKYRFAYVWRRDITKFFDTMDQEVLKNLLRKVVIDSRTLQILDEVIASYSSSHKTNNIIIPVKRGVYFLGCEIFPGGKRLRKKMYNRINMRLSFRNVASYRSLLLTHSKQNFVKWLDWNVSDTLIDQL